MDCTEEMFQAFKKSLFNAPPSESMADAFKNAIDEAVELAPGLEAYNAVIDYILGPGYMESPLEFLRCWNEGNFDACREEWPDAPAECYIGADPLFKP